MSAGVNMFESNPPYTIWSIWLHLSILHEMFLLILCMVAIYSLFSAIVIMVRLRAMTSLSQKEDIASTLRAVFTLHKWCTNVRQLIGATSYLFGFEFFFELQREYFACNNIPNKFPVLVFFFGVDFAFAANVLLIFLVLYLVQWFVSGRVDSFALHLETLHVE